MQDNDYKWFLANCDELFQKYGTSYVAIKDQNVMGVYHSYAEAVKTTLASEEAGTFIVQKCGPTKDAYTNYIASFSFMSA